MIKRYFSAALVTAAFAMPFAGTPAFATHTLCDNEDDDRWSQELQVGADIDDSPGTTYICVGDKLVVIRAVGPATICTHYTTNNDPSDDDCIVIP